MIAEIHAIEKLDQFGRDNQFLIEHEDEWLREYSDGWVVVYGEKLICHTGTFGDALIQAEAIGPANCMVFDHISREPKTFIL